MLYSEVDASPQVVAQVHCCSLDFLAAPETAPVGSPFCGQTDLLEPGLFDAALSVVVVPVPGLPSLFQR